MVPTPRNLATLRSAALTSRISELPLALSFDHESLVALCRNGPLLATALLAALGHDLRRQLSRSPAGPRELSGPPGGRSTCAIHAGLEELSTLELRD